jgi:hypothetical protein
MDETSKASISERRDIFPTTPDASSSPITGKTKSSQDFASPQGVLSSRSLSPATYYDDIMKIDRGNLYKSYRIPFRDQADEDLYKASSQIAELTSKDEINEYESAKDFLTKNNCKIQDPEQALARAAEYDHAKKLHMLVELGVDVNIIHEATSWTPLHYAADCGFLKIAVMLIAKGADVNAKDPSQNTPLHIACQSSRTSIVFLLLAAGADINAKSKSGLTPEDIARRWNKHDVIKLLKAKEAIDNPISSAEHVEVQPRESQRCRIM